MAKFQFILTNNIFSLKKKKKTQCFKSNHFHYVSVFQYSVTLQTEEQIAEECRKKPSQGSFVTCYVKHQEMCLHTDETHFCIPIPLTATPGFITDIGKYCLNLHLCTFTAVMDIFGIVCLPVPTVFTLFCGLRSIAAHWDHFVRLLLVCLSISLSVYPLVTLSW